tara:strand:+ start:14630 stop:14788 length:159 start_codon:yes stop_codon:yes gene_type:complete
MDISDIIKEVKKGHPVYAGKDSVTLFRQLLDAVGIKYIVLGDSDTGYIIRGK